MLATELAQDFLQVRLQYTHQLNSAEAGVDQVSCPSLTGCIRDQLQSPSFERPQRPVDMCCPQSCPRPSAPAGQTSDYIECMPVPFWFKSSSLLPVLGIAIPGSLPHILQLLVTWRSALCFTLHVMPPPIAACAIGSVYASPEHHALLMPNRLTRIFELECTHFPQDHATRKFLQSLCPKQNFFRCNQDSAVPWNWYWKAILGKTHECLRVLTVLSAAYRQALEMQSNLVRGGAC